MTISALKLLTTILDQIAFEISDTFVELMWNRIVARLLLCNSEGQSHFWKKSAQNLLSSYIIRVIKTKNLETSLTQRINHVISDLLHSKSEICYGAIKNLASRFLSEKEGERANLVQEIKSNYI